MQDINETFRAARATRHAVRRERAYSKSLRAWLRAQWLIGRAINQRCRELRALVEAEHLIAHLRATPRPEVTAAPTAGSRAARYETLRGDGKMGKA